MDKTFVTGIQDPLSSSCRPGDLKLSREVGTELE